MLIPYEQIARKILLIRGHRVMLDKDLAELYGVTTGNLNKAVKRNIERFPKDFMFQLKKKEFENLIFHFGRSSWGGVRKTPKVFTEHGILMLSSVLKSKRAVKVNIQIMRIFIKMRKILSNYKNLEKKIKNIEKKYDSQFKVVFEVIRQLVSEEKKSKRHIGFK
ncbi:MAG: ORF6N domain-containing protein [Candidatus Omnitrophica bacterium]|nr:ORF6N domain-containing protein [Candidatus Omnitrophota bacterium]MCF7895330.1 ORF6N domain-containing protein [Candidatus Omnitrophota bacterium]